MEASPRLVPVYGVSNAIRRRPAFPLRPALLATDDASPLVNVELSSVIPLLWRFNRHSPDKVVILSALASIFV
jgi:hypothetical protein